MAEFVQKSKIEEVATKSAIPSGIKKQSAHPTRNESAGSAIKKLQNKTNENEKNSKFSPRPSRKTIKRKYYDDGSDSDKAKQILG